MKRLQVKDNSQFIKLSVQTETNRHIGIMTERLECIREINNVKTVL